MIPNDHFLCPISSFIMFNYDVCKGDTKGGCKCPYLDESKPLHVDGQTKRLDNCTHKFGVPINPTNSK